VREIRTCCDRCGAVILEGASTLDLRCGPVRERFGESLDWCRDCALAFVTFAKAPRVDLAAADPTPAGTAPSGVVVASKTNVSLG
jgi:hypothetical protein